MDHTYNYTAEGRMGIKKHVEMSGHGKLQYSVVVNLSSAIITSNNNGKDITIQIEAPYVDQPSIKLMQNSLVIQNTDYSFFANRSDGAQTQKLYIDSFVDSGIKKISDLYSEGISIDEASLLFNTVLKKGDTGQYISTLNYLINVIK